MGAMFLGPPWILLGPLWALLGAVLCSFEATRRHEVDSLIPLKQKGLFSHVGFWDPVKRPEGFMGASGTFWAILEASRSILEASVPFGCLVKKTSWASWTVLSSAEGLRKPPRPRMAYFVNAFLGAGEQTF